ncbi:hypothetical protein GCM10020366_11270 [Saccharopolyspora gregorii]|uniref:PEP-CTERM sorting domain-containing protein n=1 Tax=Saccharopolyspora gregorii TaxID=33914 RepID=A0ABP6RMA8_9PSEU
MKLNKILVISGALALSSTSASAASLIGWTQVFDGEGDSVLSGAGTSSPSVTNATRSSIVAKFSEVTLADGEMLVLTANMTVDGDIGNGQFRMGMYDSTGVTPPIVQWILWVLWPGGDI